MDAQALAHYAQRLSAVAGTIVEVDSPGGGMSQERTAQDLEHVALPLLSAGDQSHDVPARIVHEAVDQDPTPFAILAGQHQVTDITVPQVAGMSGLPTTSLDIRPIGPTLGHARQICRAIQPT
jgi:hypothetical protein